MPQHQTDTNSPSYVSGLYRKPEDAARAYGELTGRHGYTAGDVDVMMSDETRQRYFGDAPPGRELERGTKAAEHMGKGGAIGGGIGAALAAAFAVGSSVAIPGLGLVVAGPIAAALAGAGAGAAAGGLVGAMVGAGIPEDRAAQYEKGIREGGIVVGTRPRDVRHREELERGIRTSGRGDVPSQRRHPHRRERRPTRGPSVPCPVKRP